MKQKILMTLALLMTAATGAWAQWTGGTYTATTNEELGAIIVGADATLTINEGVTVTVSGGINAIGTLTVKGAGMLTVTGANGADGANSAEYDGGGGGSGSAGFTGTLIVDGATVNVTGGNGGNGGSGFQYGGNGGKGAAGVSGSITLNIGSVTVTGGAGGNGGSAMMKDGKRGSAGQAVTETITASTAEESDDNSTWTAISGNTSSKRYVRAESTAPAVEVTTNAAQAGDFFTEASFDMPAFDATASYDIVRDMEDATYPVEFAGIPEPTTTGGVSKIVVKKNSSTQKFEFLNAITIALIDPLAATDAQNIIEADGITIKVLKGTENISGAIDYDQDNPITLAAFLADTQPGYYWIKAVPTDETSPYIGTVYSSEFLLIKGYEVTVPAKDFATFYKDEPLYADVQTSADAELYTISSVSGDQAVLSSAIETSESNPVHSLTPLLVYNPTDDAKVFLLIPADQDPEATQTFYAGFKGTLTAATIAASTTDQMNYALNGTAFVWVKNAIPVAANKCWLEVSTSNARALNIVFADGEATGISEKGIVNSEKFATATWYDLNGRKLNAAPNRKGIYIQNGKKVVK